MKTVVRDFKVRKPGIRPGGVRSAELSDPANIGKRHLDDSSGVLSTSDNEWPDASDSDVREYGGRGDHAHKELDIDVGHHSGRSEVPWTDESAAPATPLSPNLEASEHSLSILGLATLRLSRHALSAKDYLGEDD